MVPITGDDRVTVVNRALHTNDDGFLPDIEVAKPADQAHAVHLPRAFFESPDK